MGLGRAGDHPRHRDLRVAGRVKAFVSDENGKELVVNVIEAVGNYGEIFDRHFGEKSVVKMARGPNALAAKGGLMYSAPFN